MRNRAHQKIVSLILTEIDRYIDRLSAAIRVEKAAGLTWTAVGRFSKTNKDAILLIHTTISIKCSLRIRVLGGVRSISLFDLVELCSSAFQLLFKPLFVFVARAVSVFIKPAGISER